MSDRKDKINEFKITNNFRELRRADKFCDHYSFEDGEFCDYCYRTCPNCISSRLERCQAGNKIQHKTYCNAIPGYSFITGKDYTCDKNKPDLL